MAITEFAVAAEHSCADLQNSRTEVVRRNLAEDANPLRGCLRRAVH
eukprot:COSAG05_NODE_1753_length_4142_cov_43.953500_1_plen_46_part_00